MDHHPVLDVQPAASSKGEALTVAAYPLHIRRRVMVLNRNHLLMDDWPYVQIGGRVVAGLTCQIHSSVDCSTERVCSG